MSSSVLTVADRVGLIGRTESEPILWERQDDGWLTITLDDGEIIELDPDQVAKVHVITGQRRALPLLGEVA